MRTRQILFFSIVYSVAAVFAGCGRAASEADSAATAPSPAKQQVFEVKGVVQELKADGKTVVIKHEAVPGYMDAMTMPFEVKDVTELKDLQPGDEVSFRMIVTPKEGWIDQISRTGKNEGVEPSSFRQVRIVDPLEEGDVMPDYHFTNELGRAVSLSDFKGQALAITFIYTRCPYPNFCPRMSANFHEAQERLKALSGGPTNWHLLSVTFDPEHDTPPVLKNYAERQDYDPQHWSFLTAPLIDVTAITEQFGLQFWTQEGTISHNLRTVIIDANGRVQKIIPAEKWQVDELVEGLVRAARVKPLARD